MWLRRLFLVFTLTSIILPAIAFTRIFPPNTKTGIMSVGGYPIVIINGQERRLSPGAKIRNADNLIQVPGSLSGAMRIAYTENSDGDINKVWILREDESGAPTHPLQN